MGPLRTRLGLEPQYFFSFLRVVKNTGATFTTAKGCNVEEEECKFVFTFASGFLVSLNEIQSCCYYVHPLQPEHPSFDV